MWEWKGMLCSSVQLKLWLICCILLSLGLGTHQLQSSQTQVLLQLRKHLEYPSTLEIWNLPHHHGIDYCSLPPSTYVNLSCDNNSITQLNLVGPPDPDTHLPAFHFQGYPFPGLTLSSNFSMDSLATTLARLNGLSVLRLVSLRMWGPFPDKIRRLSSLQVLDLSSNFLYGSVPPKLSTMAALRTLLLDHNFFNGTVPDSFASMTVLSLSNNSFSGEIPKQYGQLSHLQYLDVSDNALRGAPPAGLFSLPNITYLNFRSNMLAGPLSVHISCSKKLLFVDLSNNRLKGSLPACLLINRSGNRTVKSSGNCLSIDHDGHGQQNSSGPDSYCAGEESSSSSGGKLINAGAVAAVVVGSGVLIGLLGYSLTTLYMRCCFRGISEQHLLQNKKNSNSSNSATDEFSYDIPKSSGMLSSVSDTAKMIIQDLPPCRSFSLRELEEATGNFNKSAFLGEGSYGKLYKGKLQSGLQVTVRCMPSKRYLIRNLRLRLDLLSKLRHPNLVCLLGHCIDATGGGQDDHPGGTDRVFLVYEYVANGNFQAACIAGNHHAGDDNNKGVALMRWSERIDVLIGVAKAVHYLHIGIIPGFFCNRLKSNNILLNQHRMAKLSDYGLSVIAGAIDNSAKSSWQMKSLEDDGQSFGFIILESLLGPSVSSSRRESSFPHKEMAALNSSEGWRQVVDPFVLATSSPESLAVVISLAKKCLSFERSRPSFEDILWNLQYAAQVQATAAGASR